MKVKWICSLKIIIFFPEILLWKDTKNIQFDFEWIFIERNLKIRDNCLMKARIKKTHSIHLIIENSKHSILQYFFRYRKQIFYFGIYSSLCELKASYFHSDIGKNKIATVLKRRGFAKWNEYAVFREIDLFWNICQRS